MTAVMTGAVNVLLGRRGRHVPWQRAATRLLITAAIVFVLVWIIFLAGNTSNGPAVSAPSDFLKSVLNALTISGLYFIVASGFTLVFGLMRTVQMAHGSLFLLAGYFYDAWQAWRVNKGVFEAPVPELHRYKFKQVAVLNVLYFATFGSELAVVSMLPLFFMDVFGLGMVQAGLLASSYAFMNLMSRPAGGLLSDWFGRKTTLLFLIAGLAVGYFTFALVDSSWPLVLAVITAMACSFFVQAGEGAVFAVVPIIKRRLTGQIAGMTGAYGNIGAVVYLTIFSFVGYEAFFAIIGISAVVGFLTLFFMEEPRGHMAEVRDDGTVELIEVA